MGKRGPKPLPVDRQKGTTIGTRMEPPLVEALNAYAASVGESASKVVRRVLRNYLRAKGFLAEIVLDNVKPEE